LQGETPDQAYFVRCDRSTMTQGDLDEGRVNVVVGFAPIKPAEFVVIQIQKMIAGTSPPTTVVVSGSELGDRLRLPHRPVLPGGFQVQVDSASGSTAWTRVDDLGAAGPGDRVYVLDPEAGEVRFGNGTRGARLPDGRSNVQATYRHGPGKEDGRGAGRPEP